MAVPSRRIEILATEVIKVGVGAIKSAAKVGIRISHRILDGMIIVEETMVINEDIKRPRRGLKSCFLSTSL
jgi:hypothetical protein